MTSTTMTHGFNRSGTLYRQRVLNHQGQVLLPVMVTVAMLIATSLFYVWCRVEAVRVGYDHSRAAVSLQELQKQNEELRGEVARLKSPERIERLAREHLELSYPAPEQIHILEPSGG